MDGVKHLFCALLWSNFSSLCLSKIGNRCKRRWANGIIREKIGAYIFSWRHQLHRFNIMISIKCVIFFFSPPSIEFSPGGGAPFVAQRVARDNYDRKHTRRIQARSSTS